MSLTVRTGWCSNAVCYHGTCKNVRSQIMAPHTHTHTQKEVLSRGTQNSPGHWFNSKADGEEIPQVVLDRRPPNDKVSICVPLRGDVHWATYDYIMYSVWKQHRGTRDVVTLSCSSSRGNSNSDLVTSQLLWIRRYCFHSDLHFSVDLCLDVDSIFRCWLHKPRQVESLGTRGNRWVHWSWK